MMFPNARIPHRFALAVPLVLAAFPAHAETYVTKRDVFPPSVTMPTVVGIELSPELQEESGYRIVTMTGFAVPFRTDSLARDMSPKASIALAPATADTIPKTNPSMVVEEGVFQPVTAAHHVFRFVFPEPVTLSEAEIELAAGRVDLIQVRGGLTADDMKNVFVSQTHATRVQLSGERVKIVDVELSVDGVVRIDSIRLFDRPRYLFFRADPGKQYRLLSGGKEGRVNSFPGQDAIELFPVENTARIARLGPPVAITEQDDHDGIPLPSDNCPDDWNRGQEDVDEDGVGDACDPCPIVRDGEDANMNGQCDALEDPDMDGIPTLRDNCPATLNRTQEDKDADGIGNACDVRDDRYSANKPWLLRFSMAVMVTSLMGAAILSVRKKKPLKEE